MSYIKIKPIFLQLILYEYWCDTCLPLKKQKGIKPMRRSIYTPKALVLSHAPLTHHALDKSCFVYTLSSSGYSLSVSTVKNAHDN